MSNVICTDDRFEVIAKYKAELLDKTNIDTSADEMAVIDNILFRMWQMGWLDRLEQPTVDAVPVRHGEWLRTDAFPHRIYCSVCYKTYVPNDRWQIWVDDELPKNYCPNCGAKMDGADGERR